MLNYAGRLKSSTTLIYVIEKEWSGKYQSISINSMSSSQFLHVFFSLHCIYLHFTSHSPLNIYVTNFTSWISLREHKRGRKKNEGRRWQHFDINNSTTHKLNLSLHSTAGCCRNWVTNYKTSNCQGLQDTYPHKKKKLKFFGILLLISNPG